MVYAGDRRDPGDQFAAMTKEMLDRYIEKIIVYSEQDIEICWKEDRRP